MGLVQKQLGGCGRHLLISGGLVLLILLGAIGWYWDTFSLMIANMRALGEGRYAAETMRSPDDFLAYIAEHPEQASLVAFDVDRPEEGIFYQAAAPRPLTGVPKLLVLVEYARQRVQGDVDPARRIALSELERYALPAPGQSNHERAVAALREEGAISNNRVAVRDLVRAMVEWNDDAATDWLADHLGQATLEDLPGRIGMEESAPPLPTSGLVLSWSNHAFDATPGERLATYQETEPADYAAEVYDFAETFRSDAAFRQREAERVEQRGTDLSIKQQRAFARATLPRGTAADYAHVLARLFADSLLSPEVSNTVQQYVEQNVEQVVPNDSGHTGVEAIASEGGSLPGVVSFVGYVRRAEPAGGRVVALFLEDLPISVFYHLMQTGMDKGFELRLLTDDAYFRHARERLTPEPVAMLEEKGG